MKRILAFTTLLCLSGFSSMPAWSGQAPGSSAAADIPVSHHDRVYAAEQFSNTVSVTDPVENKLLGVIRLGAPSPAEWRRFSDARLKAKYERAKCC